MAMNSPCVVQLDCEDRAAIDRLGQLAEAEAARIEAKYSRYRETSQLSRINKSNGKPVAIDEETEALLAYAGQCWQLSDGLFDITSGVLRRVWRFDGSDNIPSKDQVADILSLIGWQKVDCENGTVTLPPGMELDFGGLGKEYAVDRAFSILAGESDLPFLVNFGGDLRVSGLRQDRSPWRIAIDAIDQERDMEGVIELRSGALTTSGDARRFLLRDGVRYSHILNPATGWPVQGAPRSVTVAAGTCMEAGILSTLAMAKGAMAEQFLADEGIAAWVVR